MQSVDKYVYPGTTVLINKFNCQDAEKLKEIEALSTGGNLAYLQLHPIKGKDTENADEHRRDIPNLKITRTDIIGMCLRI